MKAKSEAAGVGKSASVVSRISLPKVQCNTKADVQPKNKTSTESAFCLTEAAIWGAAGGSNHL